ncbi:hypothetical protein P4V33_09245 [Brevibacillus borstelensis]|uniref:hypothetical protein n=1 Tax=Brevibacillus borstelensis TaxID=45462 RepID=UPI002E1AB410|nr:hypothetical protein [Brevibacillus borstelensis]
MTNPVEMRKEQIRWNIDQNPTEIRIKRTEKVPYQGGYREQVSDIGPVLVRLYNRSSQRAGQTQSILAGTKSTDLTWAMLILAPSEVAASPKVKDEFEVAGLGKFTVAAVHPQRVQGEIVGYQCELELVK